jgi:hypothetical protein
VYVYSNRVMMNWLSKNLLCLTLLRGANSGPSKDLRGSNIDNKVESGGGIQTKQPSPGDPGVGPASATDSEIDDLDDDESWLASANSFSGKGLPKLKHDPTDIEEQLGVVNVLVENAGFSSNTQDSLQSVANCSTKSILISERSAKNISAKFKNFGYPDVDSEKFVRFGT